MHIYAFGSICRGEIDNSSDVDVLAIVRGFDKRFDQNVYSIYSYERIIALWKEGNPFAWHLALESRMIYSDDKTDFIKSLGNPQKYLLSFQDCTKFYNLYTKSLEAIRSGSCSPVFELSNIFLGIRNFATCFTLGNEVVANFSRSSAVLMKDKSLQISQESFNYLERARILCTRGKGDMLSNEEIALVNSEIDKVKEWMESLLEEIK